MPPDVSAVTAALQQHPVAEACTQFGQACLYGLLHTPWSPPGTQKAPRSRRTWGTGEAEPAGPAQLVTTMPPRSPPEHGGAWEVHPRTRGAGLNRQQLTIWWCFKCGYSCK